MPDDDAQLRDVIRRKIQSGALPRVNCRMMWYGPGTTGQCVACERPIERADLEIECDLPAGGGTLRLHHRCYELWVAEWTACCENNASSGTDAR
jgi:hypothetical protein